MSEPFLAEIRIVGFNFPPRGWAFCDGQILPINQNQALFSLLGTTYGGDGRTTFALPDLRGRTPIHVGSSHPQGSEGGEEGHALTAGEMPQHGHALRASASDGNVPVPSASGVGHVLARSTNVHYGPADASPVSLGTGSLAGVGANVPHENRQPYLALNFCIALQGLFPSRN
jgi:microcystin-dependent protein